MSPRINWHDLVARGFRLTGQKGWALSFIFITGFFALLQFSWGLTFATVLPPSYGSFQDILLWSEHSWGTIRPLFLGTLFFFFLEMLLRGPILLVFENKLKPREETLLRRKVIARFPRAALLSLVFEIGFFLLMGLIAFLMGIPALATAPLGSPLAALSDFSLLFFGLIVFFLFLWKELSFFYALLSRISIGNALKLGWDLLQKNLVRFILFTFFLSLGLLLFTFVARSIMLGSAPERHSLFFSLPSFVFLYLSGYSLVLKEALRLLFFHSIAELPAEKNPIEEIVPVPVPDLPPAV